MKYFIDTEFIEDGTTIDLISIGIVAEDGREYYAQSVEFEEDKASTWVKEHVLPRLLLCPSLPALPKKEPGIGLQKILQYQWKGNHGNGKCSHTSCPWRSREQITSDILAFMDIKKYGKPELWGYYSAYDHVAFAQLFGTMMDLPQGFPMYTRDIKQWCDQLGDPRLPEQGKEEHNALADARWNRAAWEFLQGIEERRHDRFVERGIDA